LSTLFGGQHLGPHAGQPGDDGHEQQDNTPVAISTWTFSTSPAESMTRGAVSSRLCCTDRRA
jgi:hypothetical protein